MSFSAYGEAVCQSTEGGPVGSAAEYAERAAQTKRVGDQTLNGRTPGLVRKGLAEKQVSTFCVDDFCVDDAGVTRDEAAYEWRMDSRAWRPTARPSTTSARAGPTAASR